MKEQPTLLVAYSGCVYLEVAHAASLFGCKFPLIVATPDGKSVRVGEGWSLTADISFSEAPASDAKAILVPGGDIFEVRDSLVLDRLLTTAYGAGAVIGGICNGALLVAKSGLLRGRRMTHVATPTHAPGPAFQELLEYAKPHVAGSTFLDEDVIVDGQIVTAKPWAAIDFSVALGQLCGVLEGQKAQRWASYQRGKRTM